MTLLASVGGVAALLFAACVLAPKGWRTLIFNGLVGLVPLGVAILDAFGAMDWTKLVDERTAAAISLAVALANIVLRFATSTPVGRKPER